MEQATEEAEIVSLSPEMAREQGVDETLRILATRPDKGLTDQEAARRRQGIGPNTLEEEKENPLWRFFTYFWGPIPWMIEIAALLAGVSQRWEELGVILVLLAINGGVSFWHEHKASRAIDALKRRLALQAFTLRDGERTTIPARELVPGDIILLGIGDVVPADAQVLKGQSLSADESLLTGESLPVGKAGEDLVYSGTTVQQGKAWAVVVATGSRTRFAHTVELVEAAGARSHFQQAVLGIGYSLITASLILVALVVAFSLYRGNPVWEVVLFALGLVLAGIPQALPAVLSVTMSVGAARLARMKVIVSRLAAMDEMAGLQVLCVDKTGTLTRNELVLQEPVLVEGSDTRKAITSAALTVDREEPDPIDQAILGALESEQALDDFRVEAFRPFDPNRKRAEAEVVGPEHRFTVAKGAPQVILGLVRAFGELEETVTREVDRLGEQGFRALGVARYEPETGWRFLAILPLLDPPREGAADMVADTRGHHIDLRMLTGDHPAIGRQIARKVGMGTNLKRATDLFGEGEPGPMAEGEIDRSVHDEVLAADGFAEVTPEHKYSIIRHFQAEDRIVGMTGDGVNDAPALKQADVGIAVPGATDAARSAADLVLTERGLGVITQGVEEARRIFGRMTGYATYRITETVRLLLFLSLSVLAFAFYPITPIMIILLVILNDIAIVAIAWDNAPTPQWPLRWQLSHILIIAAVLGVPGVVASFLLYWLLQGPLDFSLPFIQTALFLKLLIAGHLTLFLTRQEGWFWQWPYPSLVLFLALELTQIAGTLVAVYGILIPPIGWMWAGIIWGYAIAWMFVLDGAKVLTYRFLRRPPPGKEAEGKLRARESEA